MLTLMALLATALLFLFVSARTLALVVGAFVGLVIDPLLFGGLLAAGVLAYYWVGSRPGASRPKLLPGNRKGGGGVLWSVLVLVAVGGAALLLIAEPPPEPYYSRTPSMVRSPPSEEVLVLRTPGLLQVSQIRATEVVDTKFSHSILGVPIGQTTARIRVPVRYFYSVELNDKIRVVRQNEVFTVIFQSPKPNLPVALDTAGIEKEIAGTWVLLPFVGDRDIDKLELQVSAKLASKASSREYIDRQRERARESLREFVRLWLVTQTRFSNAKFGDIQVYFEDERASAIRSL